MPTLKTIAGRYRVLEQVATGRTGIVFRAWDDMLGRQVAVKMLPIETTDDETRERFAREARATGTVQNPNVVTLYDVGVQDGQPFIVMEFIEGQTLAEMIREGVPLTADRKLACIEGICAGLGVAHQAGIIHRDINPSNIMIDAGGVPRILDFGLARLRNSSLTRSASIGTMSYMAPEQMAGKPADQRSDIFAVGAVMYELFAGRAAFPDWQAIAGSGPAPLERVCPGLDPRIIAIARRALSRAPADRYADAEAMRRDCGEVRAALAAVGDAAPPESGPSERLSATSNLSDTDSGNRAAPSLDKSGDTSWTREPQLETRRPRRLGWLVVILALLGLALAIGAYVTGTAATEQKKPGGARGPDAPALSEEAKTPAIEGARRGQ